jgi:ParB family chromosome partitioning protein
MKTVTKSRVKSRPKAYEKETYLMVPPEVIVHDEKLNPRQDYGNMEELMLSILENGIRNPLKGYEKDGKIILKDGHRRMRAIKMALEKGKTIERVPIIIEQRPLNEEERTLEFLIFNEGKPLTMLEQSEVIKRLLNFGWKTGDVVKRTGKARGYIENLISLTSAPMKVQHYIREEKVSAHAVIQIMAAMIGNVDKVVNEVEAAIGKAMEAGKTKATPKHVVTPKVKKRSFGKFYKWAEDIADSLAGRKDILKQKQDVLEKMLLLFENGNSAAQVAEEYFVDKALKG